MTAYNASMRLQSAALAPRQQAQGGNAVPLKTTVHRGHHTSKIDPKAHVARRKNLSVPIVKAPGSSNVTIKRVRFQM